MSVSIKNKSQISYILDFILCILFFGLLPIDTLNGYLLNNSIVIPLPFSIAQIYKIILLGFLILKLCFRPKLLIYALAILIILFLPTIFQFFKTQETWHISLDLIKISRYLITITSFYFFSNYFQNNRAEVFIFSIVYFSYFIVVANILLVYIGHGYPMYEIGEIGSKGFFYAGNEASVLLVILSAIIGKHLWKKRKKVVYFLLGFLSLFTALTLSSKTSMLGVLVVLILIPIRKPNFEKINFRSLFQYSFFLVAIVPILIYQVWLYIRSADIYNRFSYYWAELDIMTFIFSSRNTYLSHFIEVYKNDYSFLDKIIGIGESRYESLSIMGIIEIDIIDILFAQGVIGALLFLFLLLFILMQANRFSNFSQYKYSNFTFLMCILLFFISCFTGHTFNSGMAGPFIGLAFAMMYIKPEQPNS